MIGSFDGEHVSDPACIRRRSQVNWTAVADASPAYGEHVQAAIERLGEHHPIVRTEYLPRNVAGGGASSTPGRLP
jgi:hypothetical protein